MPHSPATTLNLEEMLSLGARHTERLVDAHGRTYFDVFFTQPPEAVTDWPDFIDLPARYWEAAAFMEPILGRTVATRDKLRQWLFKHIEADGLAYRPESPISHHTAELFDQSRLLYALVTWVMHDPQDVAVRNALTALAEGLHRKATYKDDYAYIYEIGIYYGGTLIRPMMQAGLVLNRKDLVDFAGALARGLFFHSRLIANGGSFKGHVHGALSAIAGALAFAIKTGDQPLLARARHGFDFARNFCTDFGFVPEHAQHDDDVVACETCAIMDYLDGAILLARHVDPQYWDIVEKTARNHLWESQIRDASWLGQEGTLDEDGVIRTHLHDRLIGAFAGWSAPHCMLANHECLWDSWVATDEKRPLYTKKVRALQNCCAGAGIRAVYQIWSNMITTHGNTVSVNVSMDRATPEMRVTSFIPFEGKVVLTTQKESGFRWRMPSHCRPADVNIKVNGQPVQAQAEGVFLHFGRLRAGSVVEMTFDLPERKEPLILGNAGHLMYRFDVTWRGDTVMSITPNPANHPTAYVGRADRHMPSYYHTQGPGPLYQRQGWSKGLPIAPAAVSPRAPHIDWYSL